MRIAVYGSASGQLREDVLERAFEIGQEIAKAGHTLVTGACPGYPYQAVLGAQEAGGTCIGFPPSTSLEQQKELGYPWQEFEELHFVSESSEYAHDPELLKMSRNINSVVFVEACIIVGGSMGTLNEFTNAYHLRRKIGVLEGSGGITDRVVKLFLQDAGKQDGPEVIFCAKPVELVQQMVK